MNASMHRHQCANWSSAVCVCRLIVEATGEGLPGYADRYSSDLVLRHSPATCSQISIQAGENEGGRQALLITSDLLSSGRKCVLRVISSVGASLPGITGQRRQSGLKTGGFGSRFENWRRGPKSSPVGGLRHVAQD